MRRLLLCVVTLALIMAGAASSACRREPGPEQRAAPDEVEFAKRYLALFPAGDFAAIENGMQPPLTDEKQRALMRETAAAFPKEQARAISVVSAQRGGFGNQAYSNLTLQYEYPSRTLVAELVLTRTPRGLAVKAVRVQQLRMTLQELNRFTLAGKSWRHYAMLLVTIAVPILMLTAFVLAFRAPVPGARWIWMLFVLLGIVRFTFNWTTGSLTINLTGLQVLGSYWSQSSPYGPIALITSIPVGAIAFLVQRIEWREEAEELAREEASLPPPDSGRET